MSGVVNFGIGITLADHFTGKLKGAQKGVTSFTTKLAGLSTVAAGIGGKLMSTFGDFSEKFAEVAQKQGDIMSLGIDTTGMESITAKAIEFSNAWSGISSKDFIGASYDIKSGISSLGDTAVGEMTRTAGLTAKATKSSVDTMTSLFATGFSIYGKQFYDFGSKTIKGWENLSQEEKDIKFGEYFSTGISASVTNFKTDGAKMSNAISTLGATATKANVSLAEQLNIMGLLQATMGGSDSATKYKAFLNKAGEAGEKLGLNFRDSNKILLEMPIILDKLREKFGTTLDDVEKKEIKDAFGTDEALALIDLLYDKNKALKKGIKDTNTLLTKGGVDYTKKMAQSREYGQELGKLTNQMDNLGYIVGKQLSPAMGWLSEKFGAFINGVSTFISGHEELAQALATGAVAFASVATVLGTVGIAVAGISFGLSTLGLSFGGLMVLATPVVAVIGAIGVAGYTLYQQWDKVSDSISVFVEGLQRGIGELSPFVDRISVAFAPMIGMFDGLVKSVREFFDFTPSDNLSGWGESVGRGLGHLVEIATISLEGLTRLFNYTVQGWSNIFSWVPDGTMADSLGVIGGIWQSAMDGWGLIIDGGMSFIRGEVEWNPSALLSSMWSGGGAILSTALDGWKAIIKGAWSEITTLLGWDPMSVIKPLWDGVAKFLSDALSNITAVFDKVKGLASSIGDGAANIGTDIADSVSGAWDSIVGFTKEVAGVETKGAQSSRVPLTTPSASLKTANIPTTVGSKTENNQTTINNGHNSFTFHIKGDDPQEIANRVKGMLDRQNRDQQQRSI